MPHLEHVGVVPRTVAESLGVLEHGFTPLQKLDRLAALEQAIAFAERAGAEEDPSQKQIIPYAVVCRGLEVFAVERLAGAGETRLHGKVSIGIGGHINPIDNASTTAGLIQATLERELAEELHTSGRVSSQPIGFINDDTQPVGQVHLGVVFRVELNQDAHVCIREYGSLRGGFLPWGDMAHLRRRMETWSVFVHDAYQRGLLG